MITRLLDIEVSHLDLLRWGVGQGADWVLVLEDDAMANDLVDCAEGLAALVALGGSMPKYVNVSESFSLAELGIDHLVRPVEGVGWAGSSDRMVLSADRPVTNTVCAILYRASFANELLATMEALPSEPVVPIDWKLNLALMELFSSGSLPAGSCWLVEPAPIVQMSMR